MAPGTAAGTGWPPPCSITAATPRAALIRLYHERWEHEVAYLALRHTLLQGRVLRSKDPAGLEQEIWALLALYQALRREMVTAAETVPGTDPDRASFTIALQTAIDTVTAADGVITSDTRDPGRIGRAVLDGLLPPRRPRVSVRKVKSPLSRWNKADPHRPAHSTPVTAIGITLQHALEQQSPTRRHKCLAESVRAQIDLIAWNIASRRPGSACGRPSIAAERRLSLRAIPAGRHAELPGIRLVACCPASNQPRPDGPSSPGETRDLAADRRRREQPKIIVRTACRACQARRVWRRTNAGLPDA